MLVAQQKMINDEIGLICEFRENKKILKYLTCDDINRSKNNYLNNFKYMQANKSIVVSSLYKSKTSKINIQCKMWQPPDEEEKKILSK